VVASLSDSVVIVEDDPTRDDIQDLLHAHLALTGASTPAEFSFALDVEGLTDPSMRFFSARQHGELLGICALKRHNHDLAEVKSMHTRAASRGQGVGTAMVEHLLAVARRDGYRQVSLETGTAPDFVAARALYEKAGFQAAQAFGDYHDSPHNTFMTMYLD